MPVGTYASAVHIASGGGGSPSDVTGLTFWFDASDGTTITGSPTVTQWRDKSGGARHLTVSGNPQIGTVSLNGLNTIAFDGTGDYGMFSGTKFLTGTACTCMAVLRYNTTGYDTKRVIAMSGDGETDWNSVKGAIVIGHEAFDYPAANRSGGVRSHASGITNAWGVVTSMFDATNNTVWFGATGYTPVASTGTFSADIFVVGGNGAYGNTDNSNVNVAEVCFYNRALNSTERGSVYTYLQGKWGI